MSLLTALDRLLRFVLVQEVPALAVGAAPVSDARVSFDPPNHAWRHQTPAGPRLSVYLVDLRENLQLRSNERVEWQAQGGTRFRRMPYRLDCHYLISAHAPHTQPQPPLQHTLLYEVTAALLESMPLVPARIYPPGSGGLAAWGPFQDVELPLRINPHDGFAKLPEFWGTHGHGESWQPAVYAVVTLPVARQEISGASIVTRRTTTYSAGADSQEEAFVEIGGQVLSVKGEPVGRAWVLVGTAATELARTKTDDEGRFIICVPASATRLWAAAFGLGVTHPIDVTDPRRKDFLLQFS